MTVGQPEKGARRQGERADVSVYHRFRAFVRVDEPHQHVGSHRRPRTLGIDENRVFNGHTVERVPRLFDDASVSVDVAEVGDGDVGDEGATTDSEVGLGAQT